jgi:hypothetical protein
MEGGRPFVLDEVRKTFVALTPEEWVRQHMVQFLIHHRGVPAGLIGIEKAFSLGDLAWRADILVYDREGRAALIAECKSPDQPLDQSTFDQVGRYNRVVGARYVVVTNGRDHFCYVADAAVKRYTFIADIPHFEDFGGESSPGSTAEDARRPYTE